MRRLPAIVLLVTCGCFVDGCGPSEADRAKAEAAAQQKAAAAAVDAKERASALEKLEAERLAALWLYQREPAASGQQITAQINSTNNVDTDGSGGKAVRLIFRDHPAWGRSSYLVLKAGDFNCYGSCTLTVTVDDQPPRKMTGRRPVTDEAIAMFVNDWQSLWKMTAGAKRLTIEFPVKAGGTRAAVFDVAGLDRSKMPRWDALTGTKPPPVTSP
jgi:hypothetical protein